MIVYTNHPSWWDAAFLIVLATRLFPERPGYGPIDAGALSKYRFMARIGLFGLEPGVRGATTFLRTAQRLLADPRAMLWVTAEGGFRDSRHRPIQLRPGVAHLAKRCSDSIIVPLALEYPFWNERTPEALCRFGSPLQADSLAEHDIDSVNSLLAERLTQTIEALATEAIARDPAAFDTLVDGTVGVGGVYDLWRRLRAFISGKRFEPSHGAPE